MVGVGVAGVAGVAGVVGVVGVVEVAVGTRKLGVLLLCNFVLSCVI